MCELTSGEDYTCDAAGGVDKVYIFPVRDDAGVSTIATYDTTGGNVTDLTLVSGKYAFAFNIEAETASFTDSSVGEKVAGSNAYTHTSTVVLHGNTADTIVNVENLDAGRHAVIHQLADGTYELLHMTNGGKSQSERASGTVYEDMNGTTLTITSKEKKKARKISEAMVQSLIAPAS